MRKARLDTAKRLQGPRVVATAEPARCGGCRSVAVKVGDGGSALGIARRLQGPRVVATALCRRVVG